jgi:hypothetical protein
MRSGLSSSIDKNLLFAASARTERCAGKWRRAPKLEGNASRYCETLGCFHKAETNPLKDVRQDEAYHILQLVVITGPPPPNLNKVARNLNAEKPRKALTGSYLQRRNSPNLNILPIVEGSVMKPRPRKKGQQPCNQTTQNQQ